MSYIFGFLQVRWPLIKFDTSLRLTMKAPRLTMKVYVMIINIIIFSALLHKEMRSRLHLIVAKTFCRKNLYTSWMHYLRCHQD